MKKIVTALFSKLQLDKTLNSLRAELKADHRDEAWQIAQTLLKSLTRRSDVAHALLDLIEEDAFSIERTVLVLRAIFEIHAGDFTLLGRIGNALEYARDIGYLNLAPPDEPLFGTVLAALLDASEKTKETDLTRQLWSGLFTCARLMARQHDDIADRAGRRLIELQPDDPSSHYSYGLFLKTRGRFAEGMVENQLAGKLAKNPTQAMNWNAGICATGAGEGEVALELWKQLGNKIEIGRLDLPEGNYPECKVRLAERPLAERGKRDDDPGLEETIWIERLSPCHGVIRSVLHQNLGVDYGDLVLIDGAPITYHTYGERKIPVFPHLTTLLRRNYRFYDFAGTQNEDGKLAGASEDLALDAVVYSHTEQFQLLCADCWRDGRLNHNHGNEQETHNVVKGRIAAPPELSPAELLKQLDAAMSKRAPCRIYIPDLCDEVGLPERAAVERRRYNILREN